MLPFQGHKQAEDKLGMHMTKMRRTMKALVDRKRNVSTSREVF